VQFKDYYKLSEIFINKTFINKHLSIKHLSIKIEKYEHKYFS